MPTEEERFALPDPHTDMVRTLCGPPYNMMFADANKAAANGTGAATIAFHEEATKRANAEIEAQLEIMRGIKRGQPSVSQGVDIAVQQAADKAELLAELERLRDLRPSNAPEKIAGDPHVNTIDGSKNLDDGRIRVDVTRAIADTEDTNYFVCTRCNGQFVVPDDGEGKCGCGASRAGWEGSTMTVGGYAFDITPLVASGKLSVGGPAGSPVFAYHNCTKRDVEKSAGLAAAHRLQIAAASVNGALDPMIDYLKQATARGAKAQVNAHYHVHKCGTTKDDKGSEFAKFEHTGDARLYAQVIVRDQASEIDGSILFLPVANCARCKGNHPSIAFWRLKNPIWRDVDGSIQGQVLDGTHFGMCPANGEPIILLSDHGAVMESIDLPGPIKFKEQRTLSNIGGVQGSSENQDGYDAATRDIQSGRTNPHMKGTQAHADWSAGYHRGKRDVESAT